MRGTGKPMEVVKKVCHNGADQDSACDSGRRTPSQAIGLYHKDRAGAPSCSGSNLLPGISSYPQKLRPGGTLFFGTAKSKDRNLDRVPDRGGFRSTLKGGMSSSPEIRGFSPGGFQYGVFRISVRIPIFAMARMSPRESHFLVVDVVRWAPNLHIFDSTHQDLTLHRECREGRLISDGITPYCLKK